MRKIKLFHGTSVQSADKIMKEGFKSRIETGISNWSDEHLSQEEFVYLTIAYPFFYGNSAADEDHEKASVLQVEVDIKDLYPDEDFIRQACKLKPDSEEWKNIDVRDCKHLAEKSLEMLSNVCIKVEDLPKTVARKDYNIVSMFRYSDPSMTLLNYMFCGAYYRELTDKWWRGLDYTEVSMHESVLKAQMSTKK